MIDEINKNNKFSNILDELKNNTNNEELNTKIDHLKELNEKFINNGVIATFLERKNNNIFRENGLTSAESAKNADMCRQLYIEIEKASLYDFSKPEEVEKWLDSLAPYLNNNLVNPESYINSGINEMENPLNDLLNELEEKGFDKPIDNVTTIEEAKHNQVVNTYQMLKKSNIYTMNKKFIDVQIDIIRNNTDCTKTNFSAADIKNIPTQLDNSNSYKSSIVRNGVINTITNILEEKGYSNINEKQDNINVYLKYNQIKEYGCILESLNDKLEQQELIMQTVMKNEETKEYLQVMENRKNNLNINNYDLKMEDIFDLTGKRKFSVSSLIERFIKKKSNIEEKNVIVDEKLDEIVNSINNASNIDTFAYALRNSKNYINDLNNDLNINENSNLVEVINNKANKLGLNNKQASEIVKDNPNMNPVLIHYAKNQLDDLNKYGCFITSKCNDEILKNKISIDDVKTVNEITALALYNDKQLPAVIQPFEVNKVLTKVLKEDITPTKEENNVIVSMINSTILPIKENILKTTDLIKQLPSKIKQENTKLVLKDYWDSYLTTIKSQFESKNEPIEEPVNNNEIVEEPKQNITISNIKLDTIIDQLLEQNNLIIDKTGQDREMRIVEIKNELEECEYDFEKIDLEDVFDEEKTIQLHKAYEKLEKSKSSEGLEEAKANFNITKDVQNYEELYNEYLIKLENDQRKFNQQAYKSSTEIAKNHKETSKNFFNDVNSHLVTRKKLDKRKRKDKEQAIIEDKILYEYKQVKMLYKDLENCLSNSLNSKKINKKLETKFYRFMKYSSSLSSNLNEQELENISNLRNMMELKKETVENFVNQKSVEKEIINIKENELLTDEDKHLIELEQEEKNKKKEEVNNKKLVLKQEEKMLSFNPSVAKEELKQMISEGKPSSEISEKLDEFINPIKETSVLTNSLEEEIKSLEEKLSNKENYLDITKLSYEKDKKDIYCKQLEFTLKEIESLKQEMKKEEEIDNLNSLKLILLKQQKNYEEEKEILEKLSKNNPNLNKELQNNELKINNINNEINKYDSMIQEKEEQRKISLEELQEKINSLENNKNFLQEKIDFQMKIIEDKNNDDLLNVIDKASDEELLNNKKEKLSMLSNDNLDLLKEDFMAIYNSELSKTTAFELPGTLINGSKINTDGTITNLNEFAIESKEEIKDLTEQDEIEEEHEANPTLLNKAKEKFNSIGKVTLEWVKKHPKLASAIGTAVTITTIAGIAVIKSLSGQEVAEMPLVPETTIEMTDENENNIVEETIEENIVASDNNIETQKMVDYQSELDNIVQNIIDGNNQVYTNIQDSQTKTNPVDSDSLYISSWDMSSIDNNKIFADIDNDGFVDQITPEQAVQAMSEGKTVTVGINNGDTTIGWTSIGGEENINEGITK